MAKDKVEIKSTSFKLISRPQTTNKRVRFDKREDLPTFESHSIEFSHYSNLPPGSFKSQIKKESFQGAKNATFLVNHGRYGQK